MVVAFVRHYYQCTNRSTVHSRPPQHMLRLDSKLNYMMGDLKGRLEIL